MKKSILFCVFACTALFSVIWAGCSSARNRGPAAATPSVVAPHSASSPVNLGAASSGRGI